MQTTKNKLDTYTYNYNYAYACYTTFSAFCLLFMRLCIDSHTYISKSDSTSLQRIYEYIYISINTYIYTYTLYIHIFAKSIIWNKAENRRIHKMEKSIRRNNFPLGMIVKNCQMESNLNRYRLQDHHRTSPQTAHSRFSRFAYINTQRKTKRNTTHLDAIKCYAHNRPRMPLESFQIPAR